MIYISIFFAAFIGSLLSFFKDYKIKHIYFLIFGLFLIFVASSRYQTGFDWTIYSYQFDNIDRYNTTNMEPLFYVSIIFFKCFSNDYYLFQFLATSISLIITLYYINKISQNPLFTLFIYIIHLFFSLNMGFLRQQISFSLILAMYYYYSIAKKPLLSIILFITAVSFHISSVVCILYFVTNHIKYSRGRMVIIIILSFSIFLIGTDVFISQISKFANNIESHNKFTYVLKYYFNNSSYLSKNSPKTGLAFFLKYIPIVFILLFFKPKNRSEEIIFILSSLSIFFGCIGDNILILRRFSIFFDIFICFLLPIILNKNQLNNLKQFKLLIFLILIVNQLIFIYPFFTTTDPGDNNKKVILRYYPYYSIYNRSSYKNPPNYIRKN